jgi:hypothetical protein
MSAHELQRKDIQRRHGPHVPQRREERTAARRNRRERGGLARGGGLDGLRGLGPARELAALRGGGLDRADDHLVVKERVRRAHELKQPRFERRAPVRAVCACRGRGHRAARPGRRRRRRGRAATASGARPQSTTAAFT